LTTATLTRRREPSAALSSWGLIGWLICLVLLFSDLWVLGPALFVLLAGYYLLSRDDGPPVVPAAFTYQWLQVTLALWYLVFTGRRIADLEGIDPQRMMLIGLIAVSSLFLGYHLVARRGRSANEVSDSTDRRAPSFTLIAISYGVAVLAGLSLPRLAWMIPALTQILLILGIARYSLLYVLMTRLLKPKPRWSLIALLVSLEVALGFTGFFAGFREPLVFIGLAILGASNRRRWSTWVAGFAVAGLAVAAALTWTAIKPVIRKEYSYSASAAERLVNVLNVLGPALQASTTQWATEADQLVSRIWMMRFQALALERVPEVVRHENGKLLLEAVRNTITPRMFFPEKGVLASSSDDVRKYAGVYVTGRERNTSFAFGYAGQSYVDFGWPWMLLPIFAFGCMLGLADRGMRRLLKSPDIQDGIRVVVLWSSLYLYEISWVMMLGTATSLFAVLMATGIVFERVFHLGEKRQLRRIEISTRRPVPRPLSSRRTQLPTGEQIPID